MKNYDYIILGTGPAGYALAQKIAQTDRSLLAVEGGLFGGTCPNVGCEPKIFLSGAVHAALATAQLKGRGIEQPAHLNWAQLMKAKKARFASWPAETKAIYEKMCDVAVGYGKFVSQHVVEVNGQRYRGQKIIIATGHRPHQLSIPGQELMHNSSDVLSLAERPKRAIFIGGGYVGIELATFLAAAGTKVDLLIRSERILRGFYDKYAVEMVKALIKRGLNFHFFTNAVQVERKDKELILTTNHGEKMTADYIVDASGRVPNLEKLNLAAAGISYTKKGINVDEHLQTNMPGVYAIGDITSQKLPKLTPVAELEAEYLFKRFTDQEDKPFPKPVIGSAVFAFPELAQAGVNPEKVKKDSSFQVVEQDLAGGSFYAGLNEQDAKLTLVYDQNKCLVGASEIGATAGDDINNLLPVMGLKISYQEWRRHVLPLYPAIGDKVTGLLRK